MSAQLSPSELETAEGMIANLEKRSRQRKWGRWVSMSLSPPLLILAVLNFWLLLRMYKQDSSALFLSDENPTSEMVATYVRHTTGKQLAMTSLYIGAIITGTVGILLLVFSLATWNRYKSDAVLAKLLKGYLEGQGE